MSYNVLNLPSVVRKTDDTDCSLTYTYLSDGTRLRAMTAQDGGKTYRGSFVYAVDSDGEETLESIAWDEGRILIGTDGEVSQDQWYVRDHLGNVRAVVDFGARFYDPFTARWTSVDPMAAKYPSLSPYAYCNNDPINFFDPDGRTDYFDNKGHFLWNDGLDNGWMRSIDESAFYGMQILGVTKKFTPNELNSSLLRASKSIDSSDLSKSALISIVNYYNQSGYKIIEGGTSPGAQFTSRNDGEDHQVLIHVDIANCKNSGFLKNSYDLINSINGHERYHGDQISGNYQTYRSQSDDQHEFDAITAQMNHSSWEKTSKEFQAYFEMQLEILDNKINAEFNLTVQQHYRM